MTTTAPADSIEVYSVQQNHVVDLLLSGQTHVQPWSMSAAFEKRFGERWRVAHKRGYDWMAGEYRRRMGRALIEAPVWVRFDLNALIERRESAPRAAFKATEKILVLRIPRSELLMSDRALWMNTVLRGRCLDHVADTSALPSCSCASKDRTTSWVRIFDVPAADADKQGVLDRIEPDWVVRVID